MHVESDDIGVSVMGQPTLSKSNGRALSELVMM
ncbi:hypothetical protein A2U01_0024324, partial [Trifolium medium]|nr:hypothetical protein [Trifolium medium]